MLKYGNRPENFAYLPSHLFENGALNPTIPAVGRLGQHYPRFSPWLRFVQSGTASRLSEILRKWLLFTWKRKVTFRVTKEAIRILMSNTCLPTKHRNFSDGRDTGSKSSEMEAPQCTILWATKRLR